MKPLYLLIILFLSIIAQPLLAQKKPVAILTIEGGPSIIKLRGNEYMEAYYKSTLGFAAGLGLQIVQPKSIFSFKTNIFYEKNGAISDEILLYDETGQIAGTVSNSITYNYITIPGLLRITTRSQNKFFINFGPYVGFLLKEVDQIKGIGLSQKTDATNLNNKMDGGISFGAGFQIPVKEKWLLSAELRDNIGFYDINNSPRSKGGSVQTNSTNFLAGVAYRIQKTRRYY